MQGINVDILPILTILLIFYCFSFVLCNENARAWPMPESLIWFWPFDADSQTNDISQNIPLSETDNPQLMAKINGPFGEANTSYSIEREYSYIGSMHPVVLWPNFTVAFYFYTQLKGRGPIFMFWNDPRFAVNYVEPDQLELWGGPEDGALLGRFPILRPNSWNFVAITYSQSGGINIFNENGNLLATLDAKLPTDDLAWFDIGLSVWISNTSVATVEYMKTTDAIACLMYYKTVLTPEQIWELPRACDTKGRMNVTTKQAVTVPLDVPIAPVPSPPSSASRLLREIPIITAFLILLIIADT